MRSAGGPTTGTTAVVACPSLSQWRVPHSSHFGASVPRCRFVFGGVANASSSRTVNTRGRFVDSQGARARIVAAAGARARAETPAVAIRVGRFFTIRRPESTAARIAIPRIPGIHSPTTTICGVVRVAPIFESRALESDQSPTTPRIAAVVHTSLPESSSSKGRPVSNSQASRSSSGQSQRRTS